ncbi:MAG TPA: DinB family protein [Gemmatimonadales bacterium]|nr:DinB family protein [Gemmatimonadales bacterium]
MSAELVRFRKMLEHDGWANVAALAALRAGHAPEPARAWMAHLVASERLWLARLLEEPSAMPVWPDLDLDSCAAELTGLQAEWMRYLESIDGHGLNEGVAYRNSKGEFWTSTVGDILTHVVLHASYHRGQIASAIRAAGGTPAYTDFIHAVRTGLIE